MIYDVQPFGAGQVVEGGIVAVGDGDEEMVADGSKPGAESVAVNKSAVSLVGIGVSVMVGRGWSIRSSAKVVESPPKTRKRESAAKRMLLPSFCKPCIAPLYASSTALGEEMGNKTLKVAPIFSSESTQMRPSWASVSVFAMDSPTPVSPTP